ncbi:carbonate dehydratase [Congregibacter litoralis]|uniref:Carbonic anhydrase n=1 Tax=Congregibacter litoralis KT71 TaxID=314285 RepID=A4A5J3_9GAMM|nr:carbonate dehydratase [Congregibacter litoralis]EAQ99064.1 Carbonic anhydrase [Congregibacter litoralis KT71]
MDGLRQLLANNEDWARRVSADNPEFFPELASQQSPRYLWIGCSDSRVPANEIVGLKPGEVFVHRNVGNVVAHGDLNCLSVLQYAVDILQVSHVVVVGHYGCGGVAAVLDPKPRGLIDNWLKHIEDVAIEQRSALEAEPDEATRVNMLCEMNVRRQVENVVRTSVVQAAWSRGQALGIHGWIYSLRDGLLNDLKCSRFEPGYSADREL